MDELNLPRTRNFVASASPWKRVFAYIIDFTIIKFVIIDRFASHFTDMVGTDLTQFYSFFMENLAKYVMIELAISVLMIVYFAVFEYRWAQTPGKLIMGIFVRSQDKKNGMTLMQAVTRAAFKVPSSFFIFLMVGDIIYFLARKRRLGDMLAKTDVVEVVAE